MAYDRVASWLMSMSDTVWMRHANPWSAWTRVATFPFVFLAVWSYVWIGWWALAPIAATALWTWLNPRIFSPVKNDRAWATKGVFGERIWMNRSATPIPQRHARAAHVLTGLAALALIPSIIGFVRQDFWQAAGGWTLAAVFKIWFVDRMVWLYEDMRDATPDYQSWRTGGRGEG